MICLHEDKEYGQVVYADGLSHVEERCTACKTRTRQGWVSKEELEALGLVRTLLPVFRDTRSAATNGNQPTLF